MESTDDLFRHEKRFMINLRAAQLLMKEKSGSADQLSVMVVIDKVIPKIIAKIVGTAVIVQNQNHILIDSLFYRHCFL